jgi:hypothetical protein
VVLEGAVDQRGRGRHLRFHGGGICA